MVGRAKNKAFFDIKHKIWQKLQSWMELEGEAFISRGKGNTYQGYCIVDTYIFNELL